MMRSTCVGFVTLFCLLWAVSVSAQDASAYFERGELQSQQGHWGKAILEYRSSVRKNPRFMESYLGMAHAYTNLGEYREAADAGRIAVKLAPTNMLAHYNLGAACYELKRWSEAEKEFKQAYDLRPQSAEANIGMGLMQLHNHRPQEAALSFQTVLNIHNDSAVGHLGLGMAYVLTKNMRGAKVEDEVLKMLDPKMAAQLERAMAKVNESDPGATLGKSPAPEAAQAASPLKSVRWPSGLSIVLGVVPLALIAGWFLYVRNRGAIDAPIREKIEIKDPNFLLDNPLTPTAPPATYTRIPRQSPDILPPMTPGAMPAPTPLALPASGTGLLPAPRSRPETMLLDTPTHIATSNSQYRAANAHFKAGNYEEALEAYKDALRMNPNHADACNGLGQTYARLEAWPEAIDAYKQALRINPDNANVHLNLGEAYQALEQPQEALEAVKQAIRITPNDPRVHYQYGLVCIALNDKGTALDEFKILKKTSTELANKLFNQIYPS